MGKQTESASGRSTRGKRKSDQAVKPEAEQQERKKAKKQTEPAAAAAAEPKPKQQKQKDQKPAKKTEEKPKAAEAEAEAQPKRQSKRQQQQREKEEAAQQEADKSVHDRFMEEVHTKETELNKHCLIMGQVETEEDETTIEDLRALTRVFVPEQVQEDFAEVWAELDEVGEDSEEEEDEEDEGGEDQDDQPDILGAIMKAILGGKMLTTKHASQMHAILKSHQDTIDKAIKSKGWQEAFCRWAALLMATHREKHWYEDTDMPGDAEAIYKRMRQQWLKLKARSDEELGGLVAEGDKSAKEEFDAYLQAVADDMRNMDYSVQDVLA